MQYRKIILMIDNTLLNIDSDVHFSFPVVAMEKLIP